MPASDEFARSIGNNITMLHFGFVSMYIYKSGKKAICIDAGLNEKKGPVMDRRFLQMDRKLQRESIKKLARLNNIDMLLTAHTGFTYDFDKAIAEWRQS